MKNSKLEQLKAMTDVVADTGDIEAIRQYQPVDATTNPSLLFKAAQLPQYETLMKDAITWGKSQGDDPAIALASAADKLAVSIGCEILSIIPGRISTEVDARLSFNTQKTVEKARELVALYAAQGFAKDRLLIKMAATWEGIRAAEILEQEGINCNLTLLFNFAQAVACGDANVFLISPFVGRILDWYKANTEGQRYVGDRDPGVISVKHIYNYYKQHGIRTVVMGASFRNLSEIESLAGCDRLTINPQLLQELDAATGILERRLSPDVTLEKIEKVILDESSFRLEMALDPMANEKLAEGIRLFIKDQENLEKFLEKQ